MSDFDEKCVYLESRHGKAVKMECLRPWSKPEYKGAVTPFSLSATYKITYEDGAEVVIGGLPAYALAQGSFWYFSDSKKEPESVFARDDRVLAYLAQNGQILRREKPGECVLPSQDEADCILNELDVPFEALEYGSEWACKNMDRWVNEWKQRGLVKWDDDNHIWRIVRKSIKEKWQCWADDYGREEQIDKRGEAVAQEAMDEEKRENKRTPKSAGLSKKKGKKSKGKPKMVRWPKNKAEHRENQMRLWGGEEGLKGYETRELKTSAGKMCTYYIRLEPNGRMRILDVGEDAPEGYYSQSSKYYVLMRNARVAKGYCTFEQRALWFACRERFKTPSGFLVQLGNLGLIRRIDGKHAEMNLGATAKGRKFLDSAEAFYPEDGVVIGGARLKRSKYTMIIEQAKIKPGTWEACDWWLEE